MERNVAGPGSTRGVDLAAVAGWSLVDVLGNYHACDVFARYLVEDGAGNGSYHAALFGYCYLRDVRHLDAGAARDQLVAPYLPAGEYPVDCLSYVAYDSEGHLSDDAIHGMFVTVCEHLQTDFERFIADLGSARDATVSAQPAVVAFQSERARCTVHIARADQLGASLPELGLGRLEPDLVRAFEARGTESVVCESAFVSVVLGYRDSTFRLTATVSEHAVDAHNAMLLARLQQHRDTCCYLQLDGFVMLYELRGWDDVIMAFLQLCCTHRHGNAHPGVIERIGLAGHDDYLVVHCPTGQDPTAVHALVSAQHRRRKVVVRPF